MNTDQAAFLDALLGSANAELVELRKQSEALTVKVQAFVDEPVDRAWSRIEKAADALVEKSRTPLTREQAVAKAIERDPQLYSDYIEAQAGRVDSLERSRNMAAQRGLAETAEERLGTLVAKAVAAGMDEDAAIDAVISAQPDLVRAAGFDPAALPQAVEKASSALAAIEAAARREQARDLTCSHAVAVGRALSKSPELYTAYLEEARAPEAEPLDFSDLASDPADDDGGEDAASETAGSTRRRPVAKRVREWAGQAEAQLVRIVQKSVRAGMAWDDATDFAIQMRPDLVAAAGGDPADTSKAVTRSARAAR